MKSILIIEDDQLLAHMYAKIFTPDKYSVVVAQNGLDGMEQARQNRPSLILLDLMMPKLTGMETLRALKAESSLATIPVVILTNLAGDANVKLALDMGAARYLIKSENRPKQVEEIVRDLLSA